jgi:hypothetical protein
MTSQLTSISKDPGLYRIIRLKPFRHTPGVSFDIIPHDLLPKIDAIDRVIHDKDAVSPGPVGNVERPWYMHPFQDDNLIVLHGMRHVELYTKQHGCIENFTVTATQITHNGELLVDGAAMLIWPRKVFHRIRSSHAGSISINLATHYEGIDMRTNFNIYGVDIDTGRFRVLRQGFLDQQN